VSPDRDSSFSTLDPDEYETVSEIGAGAYATVTKARHKRTGRVVAMKKLNRADAVRYDREVQNAARFSHPTILPVIGCTAFGEHPIIMMPFVEGGSLQTVLNWVASKKPPRWWTFTAKMIVLFGVALGVGTLHEGRVMHRDLKPDNVLLDGNHEPKICDFGCSKTAPSDATQDNTFEGIGTVRYLAPEVIKAEPYDFSADVFAFGMIMYAVLAGNVPFSTHPSVFAIQQDIVNDRRPGFPADTPTPLVNLARRCWDGDRTRRPRFQEVIAALESPEVLDSCGDLSSQAYREYRERVRGW
jgi:serine/threonine-protein kinase